MGKLYDSCQYLLQAIDQRDLDPFRSRGMIALETGFLISAVGPSDPDDPERLRALSEAAQRLFGITIPP